MVDAASLATARRRKERPYPELSGQFGRARLMVLATSCGIWRRLKFVGNLTLSSEEPRLLGFCVRVSSLLARKKGSDKSRDPSVFQ